MHLPLVTERLLIRPREPRDFDACWAMNHEPGTLDYIDFPREGSWDNAEAHRRYLEETFDWRGPAGMGYFAVTPRETPDSFLGWLLLAPEDLKGPEVEIGWRFRHAHRRKGYASEAARALVDHAFATLTFECLIADMYRANRGSMGVAGRLGMRERADPEHTTDRFVLWELTRRMWTEQQEPMSQKP
ncbi:MAG: GNAT family N-acetyltransferase [Pseudomonadota bacterium]